MSKNGLSELNALLTDESSSRRRPQSPTMSLENVEAGASACSNYEAPFNLFDTNSFETVGSDSDPYILMSPTRGLNRPTSNRGPSIALPELKHDVDGESDYSLGDLSPIKLPPSSRDDTNGSNSSPAQQWYTGQRYPLAEYTPGAVSNPFYVMRSSRKAFENCKYLLSCLRHDVARSCSVNISGNGHVRHYKGNEIDPQAVDWTLACRRVETAVIAFGGSIARTVSDARLSIFRDDNDDKKRDYEHRLPYRFRLNGSVISWDVEENPPIYISRGEQMSTEAENPDIDSKGSGPLSPSGSPEIPRLKNADSGSVSVNETKEEQPKLKYRCKRCGQLKQNHECPYRQCLHRSIGVMVYPAVNSFTAAEPGHVAPALSKMNNFVSYDSDQGSPKPAYTPHDSLSEHPAETHHDPLVCKQVSPESYFGAADFFNSPQSSLSNHSEEAMAGIEPPNRRCKRTLSGRELVHSASARHSSMFVDSVSLRPEHYRAITPLENALDAYQYPSIPLTFAERKRLSDTLFHLSNEIPELGVDVANILHAARLNNEWDLCVAELLAQIVVAMYCSEGDVTLDGLQQYLLALGISC